MARSIIRFIREKSTSVGLSGLIRLEAEGWLFALTGWIPGMAGFIIRHTILKCLAGSVGGFCLIQKRSTSVFTDSTLSSIPLSDEELDQWAVGMEGCVEVSFRKFANLITTRNSV